MEEEAAAASYSTEMLVNAVLVALNHTYLNIYDYKKMCAMCEVI